MHFLQSAFCLACILLFHYGSLATGSVVAQGDQRAALSNQQRILEEQQEEQQKHRHRHQQHSQHLRQQQQHGEEQQQQVQSGEVIAEEVSREDITMTVVTSFSTESPSERDQTTDVTRSRVTEDIRRQEENEGMIPLGENIDLKEVVHSLQLQLRESKTSQENTRSVLLTLQERQDAMDVDLAVMKDRMSQITEDQRKDREMLISLHTLVNDGSWAVSDLRANQNQFRHDVQSMKQVQDVHNTTLQRLDNFVSDSEDVQTHNQHLVRGLFEEISSIRQLMAQDRRVLYKINRFIGGVNFTGDSSNRQNQREDLRNKHSNRIPSMASVDATEGSGDNSQPVDAIASSVEERENVIGENLAEFMKKEKEMRAHVNTLEHRFVQYDAEMAKLYVMFYNLSLQISKIENKLLVSQQGKVDSDMGELQRTFYNFTQQIFNLEQLHMAARSNGSVDNAEDVRRLSATVENQASQLEQLRRTVFESRSVHSEHAALTAAQMALLNDTMDSLQRWIHSHNTRAVDVFDLVDEKVMEFNTRIQHNDDRLTRVELKVTNASLSKCEKANTDLKQDSKLSELSVSVDTLDRVNLEQKAQIGRIDRGLAKLYQELSGQGKAIADLMTQTTSIIQVVPQVSELKQEVYNFLLQIPTDCSAQLRDNNNQSGVYMIKPTHSNSSARVSCEYTAGEDWTIIQRRISGDVSFDRSWDEYRKGFGKPEGEYWIGNDNLHFLTTQGDFILHIDMWDMSDTYWFAEYNFFKIDEESTNYRLHVDGYSGNATDAMRYSNFMQFSTVDRDNDVSSTHCAKFYTSGWWYKHCHYSNLNGRYTVGIVWFNHDFDEWVQMKNTVMKIKPIIKTSPQNTTTVTSNEVITP